MSGETAQKAIARSIARHPHKDGRTWEIRTVTVSDAGSAFEQPSSTYTDTAIDPVVQSINEHEAQHIGQNMRAGDLRLILSGMTAISETTALLCDGEKVDILRVVPAYQHGVVQEYKVYVRRAPEA